MLSIKCYFLKKSREGAIINLILKRHDKQNKTMTIYLFLNNEDSFLEFSSFFNWFDN